MISNIRLFFFFEAMLPSTFAMYTTMMAFTSILKPPTQMERKRTYVSVFWLVLGGLAWPFSGAIGIPFAIEELVVLGRDTQAGKDGQLQVAVRSAHWRWARLLRLVEAVVICTLGLGGLMCLVDSAIYQQLTFVPWHIVSYNVFPANDGAASGPDIFGTEPWYFYIMNGLLNFNVLFLLALGSGFVMVKEKKRIAGVCVCGDSSLSEFDCL